MNAYDKASVIKIIEGRETYFTAHLFRLIAKADDENAALLAKGFPEEVLFVRSYLGHGPMPGWVFVPSHDEQGKAVPEYWQTEEGDRFYP